MYVHKPNSERCHIVGDCGRTACGLMKLPPHCLRLYVVDQPTVEVPLCGHCQRVAGGKAQLHHSANHEPALGLWLD